MTKFVVQASRLPRNNAGETLAPQGKIGQLISARLLTRISQCAVKRFEFSAGARPARPIKPIHPPADPSANSMSQAGEKCGLGLTIQTYLLTIPLCYMMNIIDESVCRK